MKLIIVVMIFFCSSVFAGTTDPDVPDSQYVDYGTSLNYVVEIEGSYHNDTMFYGSGILIDEHNFLTAAHVVENYKLCHITLNKKPHVVSKIIVHPDYKQEKKGFADIAIGYSEKPIKLQTYPALYENNEEINKLCIISGYGMTGRFGATQNSLVFDRKRRAGSNIVDKIENDTLICTETSRGHDTHTSMEFMIAGGDSGGPLFIDNKVAGINSVLTIIKSPSWPKDKVESAHTRISKFIPWIQENRFKYK